MASTAARYPWTRLVYPLGKRPPYRDPNGWVSGEAAGRLGAAPLAFYEDLAVIVLLAERGVGKSDILSDEERRLRTGGADCVFLDLPRVGPGGARELAAVLTPSQSGAPRHVLLDSLDEALDHNPMAWQMIADCLRELGAARRSQLRLRIACRSSRWLSRLQEALEDLWPEQITHLGVAGLTRADVVVAAELSGLDASFVRELEARRLVVPLASWPVTLKPLLKAAAQGKPLPENTVRAFALACSQLCTEDNPARRDGMTAGHPSRADLLAAGRRVAAALQFVVRDALADAPDDETGVAIPILARGTEPDGAGRQVHCTEYLLCKLTEAALLAPLSARRWGFAHRSFQEYLAAEYLRVHDVPGQVRRALLLAGDGRGRHVVDSQREVAAWLALTDDGLFEEILDHDPQVLLLADLAVRPPADRGRLTDALLSLVRDDFTVQLDMQLLYRLDHPGLTEQLSLVLMCDQPQNELYAALLIARACPRQELTGRLLALAENPELPETLRSLAIEALASVAGTALGDRLLDVMDGAPADVVGAVLSRLWSGYLSTPEMLARLPQPDGLAAGWDFLHEIPRLLRPADLTDALAWASQALSGASHREHKMLAIRLLAWALRICDPHDAAGITQLAGAVLALARSDDVHTPGPALDELSDEFASRPGIRRAVGRQVLEQATGSEVGTLTVGSALCLFPHADAAYWAGQLPSLPPRLHEQLRFPLRDAPEDSGERAWIQQLADSDALVRAQTAHWYALPINHPRGLDWRYQRERQQRGQARRAERRYDEAGLTARLAALTAGEAPARELWAGVVADLCQTPDGAPDSISTRLDLTGAPSFPAQGSELRERLILAAATVLRCAPLITAADLDPAGTTLPDVPELWALSTLVVAGRLQTAEVDAASWAGLTLALLCVYSPSEDFDLHIRLIGSGIQHAGSHLEEQIPRLLERAGRLRVTVMLSRLGHVLTPGLARRLARWAADSRRPLELWEAVHNVLAKHGDEAVLASLRRAAAFADDQCDSNPAGPAAQRWLSTASILARHDTAASWPVISARLAAAPALARPFLDRLAASSPMGGWPMDMDTLQPRELADLYDLIVAHGPAPGAVPAAQSGGMASRPGQKLGRMRSQLPQIISSRPTREAADQLHALAARYSGDWQLRELARQHARDLAAHSWQPVGLEDLLKLADDGALRLVRDERQLSDVVTESLDRLQELISTANGWAPLLWNRKDFEATSGWWPAWEEDLSDLIATFLKYDLTARQVIVNREVQILRPGLNGHRTDIHVQATPPGTPPGPGTLTVIIECKGCWNKDLANGLARQLVSKYLTTPGRNAGIYLVGYFDCARWDRSKHPRPGHVARHELDDVKTEQTGAASEEAGSKSVTVNAYVLDCRLPGDEPLEVRPASSPSPRRRKNPSAADA